MLTLLDATDRRTGDELLLVDLSDVITDADARAVLAECAAPNRTTSGGLGLGWPLTFRWRGDGTPASGTGVRAQPEPVRTEAAAVASVLRHAPHWYLDVTEAAR